MKKFEQQLKEKAHLNKIKNAKKTVISANKNTHRTGTIKNDEAQVLLNLYQKKRFDSIPAYKLLRTAGLQQYTKGFIQRGYGIKLGILSTLSENDKQKLYEDLKILPGHTFKLDKLINTISKHSYLQNGSDMTDNFSNYSEMAETGSNSDSHSKIQDQMRQQVSGISHRNSKLNDKTKFSDPQYEKQLQRVINQYTPNTNEKNKQKRLSGQQSINSSIKNQKKNQKASINFNKLKLLQENQFQSQKNLQKVMNQFTPVGDAKDNKKRTFNQRVLQKKTPNLNSGEPIRKYSKTKYNPNVKLPGADFKKKNSILNSTIQNKNTVKKVDNQKVKQSINSNNNQAQRLKNLGIGQSQQTTQTSKLMQITFQLQKYKSLNRSFDGSLMSSTIANIDIEELVYAFSGFVFANVIAAQQPAWVEQIIPQKNTNQINNRDSNQMQQSIDDEVGNILRQSYLHPLYTNDDQAIDQNIQSHQQNIKNSQTQQITNSQGQQQQQQAKPHNQFLQPNLQQNLKQSTVSSFLGGESYHFGLEDPLHIFNQPQPTQLDYIKPTVDSIANFIKNIVLTAKMQRQIPIMAAHYLNVFRIKTGIQFNSLNYKRILVTLLLLASKIWDDESFESPSFSKTFPQYTTILLNEMQKQVLKALDYKLKLDKKQFAEIYFQLRKYARKNVRSYQNKKLTLQKIRELQNGIKKDYKINMLEKRNSF